MDQATEGSIGLTIANGRAKALVRNCEHTKTSRVELNVGAGGFFSDDNPSWKSRPMVFGVADLGSRKSFTKLIPAGTFAPLFADPHGGAVHLTRSEVAELEDGNVITTSPSSGKTVTVSRTAFEKLAQQTCSSDLAG